MSINRTEALQISRRYATAIFALAVDAKKTSVVVEEFQVLANAISENPALASALSSPVVSNAQKAATLGALMKKADALTLRAVEIIANAGRAEAIPAIATRMNDMLSQQQGEVEATITSARPLAAAAQKQLSAALAKATGKKVQLKLENDPAVLGGVRIELGSLLLDATLSGALTTMRAQLLATNA